MIFRKTKKTIFSVEKNLSKKLIKDKIEKHCNNSIHIFTDEYRIYNDLKEYKKVKTHEFINHSNKEYAKGKIHVNNAENRHSLLDLF